MGALLKGRAMKLSDFDFELPQERIALRPMSPRGDAKLLVSQGGQIEDSFVRDLCHYFRPGDRLVLNDTKVIPARLSGTRARQSAQGLVEAKIEVTLMEPQANGRWKALIKPLRKLAVGEEIIFAAGLSARCIEKTDGRAILDFSAQGAELDAALDASGQMPLPPYIASKRAADAHDKSDYQTSLGETSWRCGGANSLFASRCRGLGGIAGSWGCDQLCHSARRGGHLLTGQGRRGQPA